MKKIVILGLYACASPLLSHSQSNVSQLPNGVIVHQAQGVEKTPELQQAEPQKVRTIQDWNLPECLEALIHVELKLNEASEAERQYYLDGKAKILQRINELKSAN